MASKPPAGSEEEQPDMVPGSSPEDYAPSNAPDDTYQPPEEADIQAPESTPFPALDPSPEGVPANLSRIVRYAKTKEREAAQAAAAKAQQVKRANNAAARATSAETGAQFDTNEAGYAVPRINPDTGEQAASYRPGPVRSDSQGKPFQVIRNEGGRLNKKIVNPDAEAEFGENPDDPNDPNLYRKNKHQAWEPIDPEQGIHSPDNRLAVASAKHLHKRELSKIESTRSDLELKLKDPNRPKPLSEDQRLKATQLLANDSEPEPEPAPVSGFMGMGTNAQATAQARTDWEAREADRKARLEESKTLISYDDERQTLEKESYDLALQHKALKDGGPAAVLAQRRKEKQASIAELPEDQAQAAIEQETAGLQQSAAQVDARRNEIKTRLDAITAEASRGVSSDRLDELNAERQTLSAQWDETNAAVGAVNAKAQDLNAGVTARQEKQQEEIRRKRDEMRADPDLAPIADQFDAIDSEISQREAAVAEMPDGDPKQKAMDQLRTEKESRYTAASGELNDKLSASVGSAFEKHAGAGGAMGFQAQLKSIEADADLSPTVKEATKTAVRETAIDALIRSHNMKTLGGTLEESIANGRLDPENPEDRKKASAMLDQDPGLGAKIFDGFDRVMTTLGARAFGAVGTWAKALGETYGDTPVLKQIGQAGNYLYQERNKAEALREKFRDPRTNDNGIINRWIMPAVSEALPNLVGILTGPGNIAWSAGQLFDEGYAQADQDPNLTPEQKRSAAAAYVVLGIGPELAGDYLTGGFLNTRTLSKAAKKEALGKAATFLQKNAKVWDRLPPEIKRGIAILTAGGAEGLTEVVQDKILNAVIETVKTGDVGKAIQNAVADNRQTLDTFIIAGLSGTGIKTLDTVARTATEKGDKAVAALATRLQTVTSAFNPQVLATEAQQVGVEFDSAEFEGLTREGDALAARLETVNPRDVVVRNEISRAIVDVETAKAKIISGVIAGFGARFQTAADGQESAQILPEQTAAAQAEISASPDPERAKAMAAALKLVTGTPFDALTKDEQNYVKPHVSKVDGEIVVTDDIIAEMSQASPTVAGLVQQGSIRDEAARRLEILQKGGVEDGEVQTNAEEGQGRQEVLNPADAPAGPTSGGASQQQTTSAPSQNSTTSTSASEKAFHTYNVSLVDSNGNAAGSRAILAESEQDAKNRVNAENSSSGKSAGAIKLMSSNSTNDSVVGARGMVKLTELATQDGIDLSKLTRDEYVNYAIKNGVFLDGNAIRLQPSLRAQSDVSSAYDTKNLQKDFNSKSGKDFSAFQKVADKFKALRNQALNFGSALKSGYIKTLDHANGWVNFKVKGDASRSSAKSNETHKAYFNFGENFDKALTEKNISVILTALHNAGFNGQVKFGENASQMERLADQLVLHGESLADSQLAQQVVSKLFESSGLVADTNIGTDNKALGGSYTEILSGKTKAAAATKNKNAQQTSPQQPGAPADQAGENAQAGGTNSPQAENPAGQVIPPLPAGKFGAPITEGERGAADAISGRLEAAGADAGAARAFATYYVRRDGAEDWTPERVDAAQDEFQKAGGFTDPQSIKRAVGATISSQNPRVEAIHAALVKQWGASYTSLSPAERKKIDRLVRHRLAPDLLAYEGAIDKMIGDAMSEGGGGVGVAGRNFHFNLRDLAVRANRENLSGVKASELTISEEIGHIAGQLALYRLEQQEAKAAGRAPMQGSLQDVAMSRAEQIFNALPKAVQDYVRQIRETDTFKESDGLLGLEFFRMILQRDIAVEDGKWVTADGAIITEQTLSPGMVEKLREALRAIIKVLGELKGTIISQLKAEGKSQAEIDSVVARVDEVRNSQLEIFRSFQKSADQTNSAAYRENYAQSGKPASQPAAAMGGTDIGGARPGRGRSGNGKAGGPAKPGTGPGNTPLSTSGTDSTAGTALLTERDKRIAQLEAEKAQRDEMDERARARREKVAGIRAGNLADWEKVIASAPADSREVVAGLTEQAVPGKPTYVLAVNNEHIPAVYIALPPGAVQPSHIGDDFRKNPDYAGQNTRAYDTDEAEQNKVRRGALPGALNEDILTSTDPSSANAAPQVAIVVDNGPDGNPRARWQAAGGNAREMMIRLSPLSDQERLAEAWQDKAGQFGFDNIPDGAFGYRFLGVHDVRTKEGAEKYQKLVDDLNPSTGVVQDTSDRADIDAATKIPVDRLSGLSVTLSGKESRDVLAGLIRDAEKLGLERNRLASMVKNPAQAQLYVQRLILGAAFRNPAVADIYAENLLQGKSAALTGLISDAAKSAMAMREKGNTEAADSLGQLIANVGNYTAEGTPIQTAISRAAEQVEALGDFAASREIATRLAELVEYGALTKRGKKNLNTDATLDNWNDYLSFLSAGIANWNPQEDMLGVSATLPEFIRDVNAAHRRKENQAMARGSVRFNRSGRIRELESKRRVQGLTRWESEELNQLEQTQGQGFMDFFQQTRDDRFALEGETIAPAITRALSTQGSFDFSNATLRAPTLIMSRRAYHGTPHKVGRFSLDKIGTGEGAQAFGWGLYFADEQKVADTYKQTTPRYDGARYDNTDARHIAASAIASNSGDRALAISEYKARIKSAPAGPQKKLLQNVLLSLITKNEATREIVSDGNTYTVELDVESDDLLDWDLPLSQQSEKTRLALKKVEPKAKEVWESAASNPRAVGGAIYRALAAGWPDREYARDGKDSIDHASRALREAGIPGIRFLDQGSRGVGATAGASSVQENAFGEGWVIVKSGGYFESGPYDTKEEADKELSKRQVDQTYNYVIFDESKISILEENGNRVGSLQDVSPAPSDQLQLVMSRPKDSQSRKSAGLIMSKSKEELESGVRRVHAAAVTQRDGFLNDIQTSARRAGIEPMRAGFAHAIKKLGTAISKLERKPKVPSDILRATVISKARNPEALREQTGKFVSAMFRAGYRVYSPDGIPDIEDRHDGSLIGYKDIALKFVKDTEAGLDIVIKEILILQPEMARAKAVFHKAYGKERAIKKEIDNRDDLSPTIARDLYKKMLHWRQVHQRISSKAYSADNDFVSIPSAAILASTLESNSAISSSISRISSPEMYSSSPLSATERVLSSIQLSNTPQDGPGQRVLIGSRRKSDDSTPDLFAFAAPELNTYDAALESEGITHPQAKAAAAQQDLAVSAGTSLDLFGNTLTGKPAKRITKKEKKNETQQTEDLFGPRATPGPTAGSPEIRPEGTEDQTGESGGPVQPPRELKQQFDELDGEQAGFENGKSSTAKSLANYTREVAAFDSQTAPYLDRDLAHFAANFVKGGPMPAVVINGETFTEHKDAVEAIRQMQSRLASAAMRSKFNQDTERGEIGGVPVVFEVRLTSDGKDISSQWIYIKSPSSGKTLSNPLWNSNDGVIQSVRNFATGYESEVAKLRKKREDFVKNIEAMKVEMAAKWERQEEYDAVVKEIRDLERELISEAEPENTSEETEQISSRFKGIDPNQEVFNFEDIPQDEPQAARDAEKSALARFQDELPQAMRIAAGYDNIPGVDPDEVQQTARIALAKASRAFDPGRGKPWAALAGISVRNALRSLYRDESTRRDRFPQSLDAPVGNDTTDTRGDFAPDTSTPSAVDSASRLEGRRLIDTAIDELPAKMQVAVRGYLAERQLEDIGSELGHSKQAVQQLQKAAFERLRRKLGELGISSTAQIMARYKGEPETTDDARYLELANDPDKNREELQRMVDAAAKARGYKTNVYHGSPKKGFTVFERSEKSIDWSMSTGNAFHFSDKLVVSRGYTGGGVGEIRQFILSGRFAEAVTESNTRKFIGDNGEVIYEKSRRHELNGRKATPDEIFPDVESITDASKAFLQSLGYTGIVHDWDGHTEYAVFSSNQIKSADPVTYDEQGNVIPLSKRFNPASNSILNARPKEYGDFDDDLDALMDSLANEAADYQDAAAAEEGTGAAKNIGRPDLAFGANNADVRGLDQFYTDKFLPETEAQWEKEAADMLANDYEGTRKAIETAGLANMPLSPAQTKAADQIARDLRARMARTGDPADRTAFNVFWYAYRSSGTAAGRAMAARRDPFKTPAERYREFLLELMLKPRKAAQKQIDDATDPKEKANLIDAETKALLAKLKAAGISPDDILENRVFVGLKEEEIVRQFENALTGKQKEAFRLMRKRAGTPDQIAAQTGLKKADVEGIGKAFLDRMRAQHFAKFKAGIHKQIIKARGEGLFGGEVSDAEAEAAFQRWVEGLAGFSDVKKIGKPKFNIKDPAHVMRLARAIQSARGETGISDMLYEWWIMNILSGPQTHVANITGNLGMATLNLTVQRGAEAMVNLILRDSKAARLGEFKFLAKGLVPGLAKGFTMAARAWSAEQDFFEHTVLGTPLELDQWDKLGGTRSAIPGAAGKFIRIPGRALLFADSMFKTAIGQMEAGAFAYRIAKKEGLKGSALSKRVETLTKTRGEVIAENLNKSKPTDEMVAYFARQLARRDASLNPDALVADHASDAWTLAREQTAYDMAQADGWTEQAWQSAVESARVNTFQQDLRTTAEGGNIVEDIASKLQNARFGNKLIGFFFPFVKTPYNVFRVGLRKSPLGSANLIAQAGKGLYSMKNGRPYLEGHPEAVRDLAEQAVTWGAVALLLGAIQGDDDDDKKMLLITGSPEKDSGLRALNDRAFGGSYTIRFGGRNGFYLPYGRLEPLATVLGVTTDSVRAWKRNGTLGDNMQAFWNFMVGQATNKTFLQGFQNIADLTNGRRDPVGIGVKTAMQFLVPNLIRQPMRNADDYARDTRTAPLIYQSFPTGTNAAPRIDTYAEAIKKGWNPLARIFFQSPLATDPTLNQTDKLLLNWNRNNPEEAWAPEDPKAVYRGRDGKNVDMTADEARRFRIAAGRLASVKLRGIVTAANAERPTKDLVQKVRNAFEDARTEAKSRMFQK